MKINTTKFYKAFQVLIMLAILLGGSALKAQTVVTWNTASSTNKLTGTATINGQTVNVTAVVSSNNSPKYGTYKTVSSDNIAYTGNNTSAMTNPDLPSIRTALGTTTSDLNWFYTSKSSLGYPKIVTITFDKDVVVKTLAMTDIDQQISGSDAWSENFTVSGYTFDSYTPSNFQQNGPVTTSATGVFFGNSDLQGSGSPDNKGTMIFTGSNTLKSGNALVITFDGTTAYKTNTGTNVSNAVNPFALFVSTPCTAPSITTQPAGQNVCQNATASALSVTASGTETLSYQWYSNTSNSNTGGIAISGATASTYTPSTSTAGNQYYYVVVNNSCGTATSNTATVTVNAAPAITMQPMTAQNIVQSSNASPIEMFASGNGITYQWYVNSTASTTGGTAISGATSSSYTPPSTTYGTKYYYVVVTNSCGTATSSYTTVNIIRAADTDGDGIPDINDQDNDNDGIKDTDENQFCEANPYPNPTINGTGTNKGKLLFFNFGDAATPISNGKTASATYNGVIYTATFSSVLKDPNVLSGVNVYPSNSDTATPYLGSLYDVPGANESLLGTKQPNGSAQGGGLYFTVTITATKGGQPIKYPLNLAVFDSERTDTNESIRVVTNGGNWTLLDTRNGPATSTNNKTLLYDGNGGTSQNFRNSYYSPRASELYVKLFSTPGKEGISIAVLLNCDYDNDGIPNIYDTDSDNDGCFDALEGSANLPKSSVSASGTLTGGVDSNGIPTVANGGQGMGSSQNSAVQSLACTTCYKPATTAGTALPTQHGITALQRAGADNGNWPMVRTGAWTALEANTKGFVPNRLTTDQVNAIPAANLKKGMMVYNTSLNCLQINTDGTASGWKCFNTQTCPTN